METEVSLGWNICGIHGCVLADRHTGDCVFSMLTGRRRAHAAAPAAEQGTGEGLLKLPSAPVQIEAVAVSRTADARGPRQATRRDYRRRHVRGGGGHHSV